MVDPAGDLGVAAALVAPAATIRSMWLRPISRARLVKWGLRRARSARLSRCASFSASVKGRAGDLRLEDAPGGHGGPRRLFERRLDDWRAFEDEPFRQPQALSTSERSRNDPAAEHMPQPQPASHKRSCKSARKRATSAPSATATAT